MIKIALLGEIGSGNLGDDLGFVLVRDELIRSFRERGFEVQVDWYPPSRFSSLDHSSHEIVLTGCGTLLDERGGSYVRELATIQSRGKITGILGSGMSDPDHLPPTEEGKKLLSQVLDRVSPGSWVRGQGGPDPMWLKGWIAEKTEDRELIGFNMGYAAYTAEDIESIWSKIRTIYLTLKFEKKKVTFVSCWKNDRAWYREYVPEEPVLEIDSSPRSLRKLSLLRTLISFRGHLGVVAACAGVAVLPVIFSKKVSDMYEGTSVKVFPLKCGEEGWGTPLRKAIADPPDNKDEIEGLAKEIRRRFAEFAKSATAKWK